MYDCNVWDSDAAIQVGNSIRELDKRLGNSSNTTTYWKKYEDQLTDKTKIRAKIRDEGDTIMSGKYPEFRLYLGKQMSRSSSFSSIQEPNYDNAFIQQIKTEMDHWYGNILKKKGYVPLTESQVFENILSGFQRQCVLQRQSFGNTYNKNTYNRHNHNNKCN